MEYTVTIDKFEGPLDLLLHLIKQSKVEILDIELEQVVNQYCNYIHQMEAMNLNIASEYLIMAAELLEMKSRNLLPRKEEVEEEVDPKEELIKKLIEYQKYKEITPQLKDLETSRNCFFTREPEDLRTFQKEQNLQLDDDIKLDDLLKAFQNFLDRKILEKPLNTKVTKKEYSVSKRSLEIKNILKIRKKVKFEELFETYTKDYIVVTFLSILDLAKKQELKITQERNLSTIILEIGEKTNE